jgi:hypothetical protein
LEWSNVDGNRASLTQVRLGHMSSTDGEVLSGLRANQRVIRHPPNELADGARVIPIS